MSHRRFDTCSKIINVNIIVLVLCFGYVNTDVTTNERVLLCSKSDHYSCKCVYFTDQLTELAAVNIDCSASNITSMNSKVVVPKLANSLDLSLNDITTIASNQLWSSLSVTTLNMRGNRINLIEGNAFKNLPNLKYLDLSDNLLDVIKYDTFKGLTKLTHLNLEYNNIEAFEKHTFKPMPYLTELKLSHNNLGEFFRNTSTVFESNGFNLNQKLSTLHVAMNNITQFHGNFFKSAYNLREITLAYNNFKHLPKLPFTVEHLDISSTQIFTIGPKQFSNLPALTTLVMNDLRNLTRIENHTFETMKNLQVLQIEHCKNLQRFHPAVFGMNALENDYEFTLRTISFLGSGLKTLDEKFYPLFSRLSNLDLRGNPWNCDCHLQWLLQLKIKSTDKSFIRCHSPKRLHQYEVWSLKKHDMKCRSNPEILRWLIANSLILLCVAMTGLAIWLVLMWPTTKKKTRDLHPSQTAYSIIINPNNAENI